jgi:hypothetical protein
MATTTNYGWDTPDDTDLVKDGALAIRDLGQDVDTSLFGITGGGNLGLVHINSTSISAATQVSVNNVFTSAYQNYLVLIDVTKHTGSTINLTMRLRAGGVDNTAAVYDLQTNGREGTTQFGNLTTSDVYGFSTGPRDSQTFVGQFFSPNVSSPTKIINTGTSGNLNGTFLSAYIQRAQHRNNYQADGFTAFFTNSTNGIVRVYGYRD